MDITTTGFIAWSVMVLTFVVTTGYPAHAAAEQEGAPASSRPSTGEVQERGVTPGLLGEVKKDLQRRPLAPGPASPPPHSAPLSC